MGAGASQRPAGGDVELDDADRQADVSVDDASLRDLMREVTGLFRCRRPAPSCICRGTLRPRTWFAHGLASEMASLSEKVGLLLSSG